MYVGHIAEICKYEDHEIYHLEGFFENVIEYSEQNSQ